MVWGSSDLQSTRVLKVTLDTLDELEEFYQEVLYGRWIKLEARLNKNLFLRFQGIFKEFFPKAHLLSQIQDENYFHFEYQF
jgi:hypothetical protein